MPTKRRHRASLPGSSKKPPRPAAPIDPVARYDVLEVCGHTRLSRAYIYRLAVAEISSQHYPYRLYPHGLVPNVVMTEGVHRLRERLDCYWLIDKIATLQADERIAPMPMQFWKLTVLPDPTADKRRLNRARLICEKDEDEPVYSEDISFTDFPADGVSIWVEEDGERRVIYLPAEY